MLSNSSEKQLISKSISDRDFGSCCGWRTSNSTATPHAVVRGANQTLGIIKHTSTSRSPSILTRLYKSQLKHRLEYGMCIATPINKTYQTALESVQRLATKCIKDLKDKEYGCWLQSLKLPTLTYHKHRGNMIITYKLLWSDGKDMFETCLAVKYWRSLGKAILQVCHDKKNNNFFYNQIIILWNSLSKMTLGSITVNSFKSQQGPGNKTMAHSMGCSGCPIPPSSLTGIHWIDWYC